MTAIAPCTVATSAAGSIGLPGAQAGPATALALSIVAIVDADMVALRGVNWSSAVA